jgi:hypothetical protein
MTHHGVAALGAGYAEAWGQVVVRTLHPGAGVRFAFFRYGHGSIILVGGATQQLNISESPQWARVHIRAAATVLVVAVDATVVA